ncbi:ATP-binding protein [Sedimenticola thiotaurini]|uniref:ATPase n=1 Tax=Sedimenticola thiotaurini TaxID=1543721 RepID=A0A0F7K154_9GAMM|nr:ATP-binding protein [Sedimenticola thiotaurini]AKH21582.1 ATPase [Sedimenticola thiotaurini]
MTTSTETCIGRITEIRENIMMAELLAMTGDEFPVVSTETGDVAVGQLGTYLMVKQRDKEVVAMVISAGQQRQENGERCGILTLVPLGELDSNRSFHRGVIHYPTPGAKVHVVRPDEINILFKKFQSTGFELGYLPTMTSVGVCLDPTALFGRHMAILGQSGAGKSWSVASILQRTASLMPKAKVILLDLHGEYVWEDENQRHSAFKEGSYRYIDARNLEIPYWLLTYGELVDLLIDRDDDKASTQMAFLREALLMLRRKANSDLDDAHISIDSPVYFSLAELFHQFKRANEQVMDFGKVKGALYGQFDEFLIKLQSRFNDVRYDFLFKPKRRKSSDTLVDLLREFVGLVEPQRQITVIDFSSVPFDVRPTVSAQIGRLAFEFNYWNPQSREFPLLLVCEEAHNYIPREAGTQFEGTRRSMERIAKEGRKYGVGLAVVSQRPHELSETVLAQCSSFICLRVTNPEDQQYIRDLVPDAESNLVNILAALGRGEAMALGEAVPLPTRFQFHVPDPAPNSNDIDFFNMWRDGPGTVDVEAIVRRWRRQGR